MIRLRLFLHQDVVIGTLDRLILPYVQELEAASTGKPIPHRLWEARETYLAAYQHVISGCSCGTT